LPILLANIAPMSKSDEVLREAKEDITEVSKKSGPAGLVVLFYIVAAIGGLVLIVLFLWAG
jgi:hypothetical protein